MMKRWGAAPEDWAHLKRLAKADLLPVVSNPTAEISPRSRMKALGKTPSVYDHNRQVIGFKDWTNHETTVRNIEAWSDESDFGICIQTRRIRGLDIDVPDVRLADRVQRAFIAALGLDAGLVAGLPARTRAGTGKHLLAFVCEGEFSKRSFVVREWQDGETGRTKRWLVEFLAGGQQFIAVGTHPDGTRYEWVGGLPDEFPMISARAFERAWDSIVEEFALEGIDRRANRRDPTLLEDLDVADPVAEYLVESDWPTYGYEKGMLYLDCPWKDGHSTDNGETETAWMLAGTGKYRSGHFKCQHTGCADHKDPAFLKAVGYRPAKAEEFEDLTKDDQALALYEAMAPGASPKSKELKAERKLDLDKPLPAFDRDARDQIESNLKNLTRALSAPQAVQCELSFDEFRGELMFAERPGEWQSLTDGFGAELVIRVEDLGFKNEIGPDKLRRALDWISDRYRMDTAAEWLMNVVPAWDGVPRIHRFWPDYMQTKDTAYTRALGNYNWTAQAGRILAPGSKADMVPVLVGPEGTRKSTAVSLIAPNEDSFTEFNLGLDDEKLARLMRGCLVGELAELRGISARDGEAVLAWIVRKFEKWTPKFKEYAISLARRCVFYGTTNDPEFLQSHMGFRRWLPVLILGIIDTDKIVRDRMQLWAEGRDTYLCEGIEYAEVEKLAKAELASFQYVDPWFDKMSLWLDQPIGEDDDDNTLTPRNCGTLTTVRVLRDCFGFEDGRIKRADQMRAAAVLKACGMVQIQRKIAGRTSRVWVPTSSELVVWAGDRRTREGRS